MALDETTDSTPVPGSILSTPPHPCRHDPPMPQVLATSTSPLASSASVNGMSKSRLDALTGIAFDDRAVSAPVAGSTVISPPHPGAPTSAQPGPNARASTT